MFFTQTLYHALYLTLIWFCLSYFEFESVAIAFFLSYIVGIIANLIITNHLISFRWNLSTRRLILMMIVTMAVAFAAIRFLPLWYATAFEVIVTSFALVFCLRGLVKRIGYEHRLIRVICRIPGGRFLCGLNG